MVSTFASVLEAPPRRRSDRRTGKRVPPPPPPSDGDDGPDGDPGSRRPILDNERLATLVVIGGEVMLFAGLISAYLVLRLGTAVWPPPLQPRLPVAVTGINTLVLLASSAAMVAAGRALAPGKRRALVFRLRLAAGLGALFLVVQGYEWIRLVGFGLTLSSGSYGTAFYTLIGAHALHVVAALMWLGITIAMASRGRFDHGRTNVARACAMYWHFVVGLWPVLYVTVYLV